MTRGRFRFALLLVAPALSIQAARATAAEVGPSKGSLVVVGGAMKDEAIVRRIIDLAGGPDELIVVVPTAGTGAEYDESYAGLRPFRAAGAKRLTVLHTRDRTVADSEAFVEPLRRARGVFFDGGRQWRLADAYLHTRTQRELQALLDRGGVIGGSSAGATILGSFLVRGDTKGNETMIGDHQEGFGFLRNVAVDQHVLRRNRQFDMLGVLKLHPNLLGLAIDEDTAIVVRQDELEVIGRSYAIVYDTQREIPPGGSFYFLAPGDRYNLATREASRPTVTMAPIERVKKRAPSRP